MYDLAKKRRILVVEDEADILQVLCFFLKRSGFDALGIFNGQEAMQVIPEYRPHLIILDLMMHPVSGWDVLHWLRSQYLAPPPVLVLTALVQLTEQLQGLEAGAVDYLTKPTQPGIIVERVHDILAMNSDQRIMLQRKRMDEQRRMLERVETTQKDEFVY